MATTATTGPVSLQHLPSDVLIHMCLELLSKRDITSLRLVCRALAHAVPAAVAESKVDPHELCWAGKGDALRLAHVEVEHVRQAHWLRAACSSGRFDVARWMVQRFALTVADVRERNNFALRAACEHGRLDVVQWLLEAFPLTPEDAGCNQWECFRMACLNGHAHVVHWLADHFELTRDQVMAKNGQAFVRLCCHGQLEHVKWFVSRFRLSPDVLQAAAVGSRVLCDVCVNGHLEVAQWLYEEGRVDPPMLVRIGVTAVPSLLTMYRGGRVHVLKWLVSLVSSRHALKLELRRHPNKDFASAVLKLM